MINFSAYNTYTICMCVCAFVCVWLPAGARVVRFSSPSHSDRTGKLVRRKILPLPSSATDIIYYIEWWMMARVRFALSDEMPCIGTGAVYEFVHGMLIFDGTNCRLVSISFFVHSITPLTADTYIEQ